MAADALIFSFRCSWWTTQEKFSGLYFHYSSWKNGWLSNLEKKKKKNEICSSSCSFEYMAVIIYVVIRIMSGLNISLS